MDLQYFYDKIIDELDGAQEYIKNAMEIKAMDDSWGKRFYEMAQMELDHATMLYKMSNELYTKTSKAFSEPPKYMQDIHHNINECYTDKYAKVKVLLDAYNK